MLALFLSALPRPDMAVGIAHVEHGLRGGEGEGDAAWVGDLAGALGLPFRLAHLSDRPSRGQSPEEWAREGRYGALEEARLAGKWDFTATAHSSDDQAETVLLRIARGAGLGGLAGILPRAGRVLRPVLSLSGAELRRAARECGLGWREDATNGDMSVPRNRVRREVLPLLESAMPGISRHLAALAPQAAALVPPDLENVATIEAGSVYYSVEVLRSLGREGAVAALKEGLKAVRGDLRRMGRAHYEALWSLLSSRPGAAADLPIGWQGIREKTGLRLHKKSS
jgi:tRNA(Ile)-lysidine synthase